jgi:hypothetical protein
MSRRQRISLSIRKDPGVRFYLAGVVLFTLGLLIYLFDWVTPKKRKEDRTIRLAELENV